MAFFTRGLRLFSTTACARSAGEKNALGGANLVEAVFVSTDGKLVFAIHPTKQFPYEHTRPIPVAAKADNGTLIKDEAIETAMQAFKNKHPEVAREELMRLTHTTKHRWFPRSRDRRAKKTPMDRPYL